jgi:peptidoglycan/xylan/chitin deacetylase (PgdA/CDA1 family)
MTPNDPDHDSTNMHTSANTNSALSRRHLLRGIGVVGAFTAVGRGIPTASAQTSDSTLIIGDPDGTQPNDYRFSVTGDLERLDDPRGDDVDGDDAVGTVYGGRDGYRFTGEVTSFSADGEVTLELNGESVTVEELTGSDGSGSDGDDEGEGSETRTIIISDPDGSDLNDYSFTVSGELARRDDPRGDDVDGDQASGTVAGGADGYSFTGAITSFEYEPAIEVTIDGDSVDPATLGDGSDGDSSSGGSSDDDGEDGTGEEAEIRISAVGESARYQLTASQGLTAGKDFNSNDVLDGLSATGTIGGRGSDNLYFRGDLTDFALEGPAEVFIDGQQVDPDTLGTGSSDNPDSDPDSDPDSTEHELRVNAVGESARIELSVSGTLTPGADYDEGTDSIDDGGSSAILTIGGQGSDNVFFTGEIESFARDGPAEVFIDGEQTDPAGEKGGTGNGRAIFIFDDGDDSALEYGEPVLSDFDYPGTVAVVTEGPQEQGAEFSSYLTIPQLRDLEDLGWELCSHTVSHDDLTDIPFSRVDNELRESKDWLDDRGFTTECIVYPRGGGSDRIDEVARQYYDIGFGGGGKEPPHYEDQIRIGRYAGHRPEEVLDAIERESAVDGDVPIMLHDIVADDPVGNEITVNELRRFCEAIEDVGMDVLTATEYEQTL